MCKIMAMAGIKNSKKAFQFLIAAQPFMTKTDDDGLGYAAFDISGNMYSEKWVDPKDAWKFRSAASPKTQGYHSRYPGIVQGGANKYAFTGIPTNNLTSVIYHSRMATCAKGIDNAHPFVKDDTALIHNGVITNHGVFKKTLSTCDSEALLTSYLESHVGFEFKGLKEAMFQIDGYFACALLTKDRDGRPVLDLWRETIAPITVTYIPQLGVDVFCTSEEIVQKTCKKLKWEYHPSVMMKDCTGIRLCAITGKLLETVELEEQYAYDSTNYGSKYNSVEDYAREYNHISSISDNRPSVVEVTDSEDFEKGHCWVCERNDALLRKSNTCSIACEDEGARIIASNTSSKVLEDGETEDDLADVVDLMKRGA